jgi:hypothetical protein
MNEFVHEINLKKIKKKHLLYTLGDEYGRSVDEVDVEWLIEQAEKVLDLTRKLKRYEDL